MTGGDELADLGDGTNDFIVSGLIEEDGVIGFFMDFSLGPFLHRQLITLVATFLVLPPALPPSLPFPPLPAASTFLGICGYKIILF